MNLSGGASRNDPNGDCDAASKGRVTRVVCAKMAREYDHLFKLLIIGDSGKYI